MKFFPGLRIETGGTLIGDVFLGHKYAQANVAFCALARLQRHRTGINTVPFLAEWIGKVVLVLDGGWRRISPSVKSATEMVFICAITVTLAGDTDPCFRMI